MKVQGADILGEVTERTSRNLKATAAIVIAVKLFKVSVQDLEVLSVKLPPNLFDVVSFALLAYMMTILVLYWHVDYLLWRDGSMMAAMNAIQERLRGIKDMITDFEQFRKRDISDNIKFTSDHLAAMKAEVLNHSRSIAATTWWVRFVIFVLHLALPLGLGAVAIWMVAKGAWAALTGL